MRKKLNFYRHKKILTVERDSQSPIKLASDLLALKGSLHSRIKASPKQVREYFKIYLAKQDKQ